MDRAPLEQRGQPQPILPNEMLHERKHKTASSGCPSCTHSYFLGYLQNWIWLHLQQMWLELGPRKFL